MRAGVNLRGRSINNLWVNRVNSLGDCRTVECDVHRCEDRLHEGQRQQYVDEVLPVGCRTIFESN